MRITYPRALLALGLTAMIAAPLPATAQSDARIQQIETQLRALQRAVFPGGDERFFEPEITAAPPTTQQPQPGVSGSALTDVLARLSAIESQLARLTATTEINENALSAMETRLATLEASARAASMPQPGPNSGSNASGPIVVPGNLPAAGQSGALAPAAAAPPPAATAPTPARLAAVQAIAKPATGDIGADEYTYGFRLWEAGFYPEAQQQLALYLERYPSHAQVSFGRNLLGRAFLDAGDPRRAATHFFENYQADKQSARAPDSLLFLAESMSLLDDTRRACIALAEFGETYPALAAGRLQTQYAGLVGRIDCD